MSNKRDTKVVKETRTRSSNRHNPLAVDILESTSTLAKAKPNSGRKGKEREERRESKKPSSVKIDESLLSQARKQQKEEDQ